jgi:hypothetical protein
MELSLQPVDGQVQISPFLLELHCLGNLDTTGSPNPPDLTNETDSHFITPI